MYVLMINKTIKFSSFSGIFLGLFSKRNKKYFLRVSIVIETLMKVWENSKKLSKHLPAARGSHSIFWFSPTTTHVSITR